jgi:N-acyl-D-aspartate/D-glutamate deacylase
MGILIQGGTIYDGSGGKPFVGDILIEGDKIIAVNKNDNCKPREFVMQQDNISINAAGKIVAPGFIDTHRHADAAMFTDPAFGVTELAQGISTTVVGNCGISPTPFCPATRAEQHRYIEPVVGPLPQNAAFRSYAEYAPALEAAAKPLNIGFLAGAGAIKSTVKGLSGNAFASSPYTASERAAYSALLNEALDSGALGLSFGIMYEPECFSSTDELIMMALPLGKRGGILCTHIRGEGNSLLQSVQEVIAVAKQAGVALNISHFKATGVQNWRSSIYRAIDAIENARNAGQTVTADFYPYDGGATTIASLLPPGLEKPVDKMAFRKALYADYPNWDNMVSSIGWERIVLCSSGKTIAQSADEGGYADPADLLAELAWTPGAGETIIVLSMAQDDVDTVAALPWTALISDSLYGISNSATSARPHPRLNGAFPKFWREYVREKKILKPEIAIAKMTGLPAARFGIEGRGVIAEGNYADIVLFDAERFTDHATWQHPTLLAAGMDTVLVNGIIAWQDGSICARAGAPVFRLSGG